MIWDFGFRISDLLEWYPLIFFGSNSINEKGFSKEPLFINLNR